MHERKAATVSDTAAIMIDTSPSITPQLYMAIGHGITVWQSVESALCAVFAKVSTCQDSNVAAAIYYGPRDFSQKLELTHYAARLSLSGSPLLEEWASLRTALTDAAERRNNLAHFHLSFQISAGSTAMMVLRRISHSGELIGDAPNVEGKPLRAVLQPNASNPNEKFKKNQKLSKAPMRIQDIVKTHKLFGNLQASVKEFAERIPLLPAPQK